MVSNRQNTGSTINDDSRDNPSRNDPQFRSLSARFIAFPWALVVIALTGIGALLRLRSNFWLDETLSYWTAGDNVGQLLSRCILWTQSVLYTLLILGLRSMGTHAEWVYRLPSFLAIGASTLLLFRLTRRLFGSEIAWMTAASFVLIPSVRFAAGDARPYAFALLLVVVSSDLFVRFLDRPDYKSAALYGFCSAAVLYFQILFGAVLLFHGLFLLFRIFRSKPVRLTFVLAAIAVLVLFAMPVVIQYGQMSSNPASHSFATRPGLDELASSYMPLAFWYVLEMLAVLALLGTRVKWEIGESSGWAIFAVLWAFVPPAVLFAASRVSIVHIFIPRYILPYAPGFAMCMGLIWGSFRPPIIRAAILCLLAVFALRSVGPLSSFHHTQNLGDWGAAASYIDRNVAPDNAPVVLRSQYPESDYFALSPVKDNGVFSQLSFYPIKARIFPIPNTFTDAQDESLHTLLRTLSENSHRFLFVSFSGPAPLDPWLYYLRGELGPEASVRELADFDGVSVMEFSFPPQSAAGNR